MWRDEEGDRRGATPPPPVSGRQSSARPHGSFVQWQQSGERACVWCRASRVGVFAQRLSHGFGLVTRNTWCLHSQRSAAEQGQAAATSQVEWDQVLVAAHFGLLLVKQEKEAVKGLNAVQAGPETGGEWWSAGAEGKTVAWRISCQQWLNKLEHEIMSMRTTTRRSLGCPKTRLLILPKRVWQHLIWKYDSNLILEKYRNASVVEEDWHEEDVWNTVIQTSFCVTCRVSRAPKIPHFGHHGNCLHHPALRCAPVSDISARQSSVSFSRPCAQSVFTSERVCPRFHLAVTSYDGSGQLGEQISGCHCKAWEMSERLSAQSWYLKGDRSVHR